MRTAYPSFVALSLVTLLAACGGGDGGGGDFQNDPRSSGRSGALTVSAASDANLNGLYASSDVLLNDVEKFNPIGGDPETCRTHFSNLQQASGGRLMDGQLRYLPGTNQLLVAFISINTVEFRIDRPTTVTVNRGNNLITFAGAVLTASQGSGQTLTLNGTVPIRAENKPEGC